MRHPLKELSILDKAQHQLELAEKLVAIKFTIEVLRILAKYKKNGFQAFYCGQKGDSFFVQRNQLMHQKEKLPKDMEEIMVFFENNSYILNHISEIKPGAKHDFGLRNKKGVDGNSKS